MPDVPGFKVPVPVRCFEPTGSRQLPTCGELAGWTRPSTNGVPVGYFCHRHRQPGDEPIAGEHLENRVRLTVEITIAGTSWGMREARSEALERLRLAIEGVHGLISLHQITSTVGRSAPEPADSAKPGNGGRGQ